MDINKALDKTGKVFKGAFREFWEPTKYWWFWVLFGAVCILSLISGKALK